MSVVARLDDYRPAASDAWSPRRLYRAGEVIWWHGVPLESLVHDNAGRPEVVVEGHLYCSPDWAAVWDKHGPNETQDG